METFNEQTFADAGLPNVWGQHNESLSKRAGTVRGLHWQTAPAGQSKLVRCTRGAALDVAVDLRRSSPTFTHYVAVEIRPDLGNALLVPEGFAHGYSTLEDDTIVQYLMHPGHSDPHVQRMRWNDPTIAVDWRVTSEASVSAADDNAPLFTELDSFYD